MVRESDHLSNAPPSPASSGDDAFSGVDSMKMPLLRRPDGDSSDAEGLFDSVIESIAQWPVESSEDALIQGLLNLCAERVPGLAFGASFREEERCQSGTFRRVLPDGLSRASADDGGDGRLFPERACERILSRCGDTLRLHVGGDDPMLSDPSSPLGRRLERLASVFSLAVDKAKWQARAMGLEQNASELRAHVIQLDKLATFGQLAAGILHELNNPITSVVAYSDMLVRKLEGGSGIEEADVERLRRISESGARMRVLTRDLVSYVRPSGTVHRPTSLKGILDQAILFCEHEFAAASAVIERAYADDAFVDGISHQLVQVFINLLTNACHALPSSGGRVSVSTTIVREANDEVAPHVRIVIADNGHGIAPIDMPRVFKPFFTTKSEERGSGLGLSIVQTILEEHGGTIRVESEYDVKPSGTRFEIALPLGKGAR